MENGAEEKKKHLSRKEFLRMSASAAAAVTFASVINQPFAEGAEGKSITNPVEEKQMEMKGKVFRGADFLKINNPSPGKAYRLDILTDKEGAKDLGGLFGIRPVTVPGEKPSLHYHQKRESIIVILTGEGEELLDGEATPVKAGDVIYIRPLTKHTLVNKGQTEMKYIEFFTHPPVRSDYIEVK